MISMEKEYKTRDGCKVTLYVVDAPNDEYPVHGRVEHDAAHNPASGSADGTYLTSLPSGDRDLIEVPVVHTVWLNIYTDFIHKYLTREDADDRAGPTRLACFEIEYHKGEGL